MNEVFQLINTLQILYYLPLIDVKFPTIVKKFLSSLNLADLNITISFVESLFHLIVKEEYLDNKPFNAHFGEFGIKGTVFLI